MFSVAKWNSKLLSFLAYGCRICAAIATRWQVTQSLHEAPCCPGLVQLQGQDVILAELGFEVVLEQLSVHVLVPVRRLQHSGPESA